MRLVVKEIVITVGTISAGEDGQLMTAPPTPS
jgi:hypothetical protein